MSDTNGVWPFYTYAQAWVDKSKLSLNTVVTNATAKDQGLAAFKEFLFDMKKLEGMVCAQCSGWGHIKDSWTKSKSNKKRFCHTTEYNDTVYKLFCKDKERYKDEMRLEVAEKKRTFA
jgi:hypothetical protein